MKVAEFIGEGEKASPFRPPSWGEIEHVGGVPFLPRNVVVMDAQKVTRSVQRCLSIGEGDLWDSGDCSSEGQKRSGIEKFKESHEEPMTVRLLLIGFVDTKVTIAVGKGARGQAI